jgi:hypothetical protein
MRKTLLDTCEEAISFATPLFESLVFDNYRRSGRRRDSVDKFLRCSNLQAINSFLQ